MIRTQFNEVLNQWKRKEHMKDDDGFKNICCSLAGTPGRTRVSASDNAGSPPFGKNTLCKSVEIQASKQHSEFGLLTLSHLPSLLREQLKRHSNLLLHPPVGCAQQPKCPDRYAKLHHATQSRREDLILVQAHLNLQSGRTSLHSTSVASGLGRFPLQGLPAGLFAFSPGPAPNKQYDIICSMHRPLEGHL